MPLARHDTKELRNATTAFAAVLQLVPRPIGYRRVGNSAEQSNHVQIITSDGEPVNAAGTCIAAVCFLSRSRSPKTRPARILRSLNTVILVLVVVA